MTHYRAMAGLEPATSLPLRWRCYTTTEHDNRVLYPTELHRAHLDDNVSAGEDHPIRVWTDEVT